jgi:hypothetical protein
MIVSNSDEGAKLDALISEMLPMLSRLGAGYYRQRYEKVSHIAHGWMTRIVRTIEAILILQRDGFAGEVSPLSRSVVEHSVALRWLVAADSAILGPLRTNHKYQVERFASVWKDSAGDADNPLDEDKLASVIASLEHDEHSRDNLQQFLHRAEIYGKPMDITAYQAELMSSHATYHSASDYWDGKQRLLSTHHTEGDYRKFAASFLYMALNSYSSLFLGRPWSQRLIAIRKELVELDAALDNAL